MSGENRGDVRSRLTDTKYFTLRPKPLEQWLWKHRIPATAERLFWLHWEEGMRNGTWCSEVALARAASTCCVDISTVTRAYRRLGRAGLIRRTNPGHDPRNPFQQAITVTEVLIPRSLADELDLYPNRPRKKPDEFVPTASSACVSNAPAKPKAPNAKELSEAIARMSDAERASLFEATRRPGAGIQFDPATKLEPSHQRAVLGHIESLVDVVARSLPAPTAQSRTRPPAASKVGGRPLSTYSAGWLRRRLIELRDAQGNRMHSMSVADEFFRQVLWSMQYGSLSKFESRLAINIAVKKIREGRWTRPNKMPPNWGRADALPELCVAA